MNNYDIAIIGAGPAGAFAALKLAQKHKHLKCALIDFGKTQGKRRRQLEGYLGCFPFSDMKYYTNDISKVADITGKRPSNTAHKYVINTLSQIASCKITKDKLPKASLVKKFNKLGFEVIANDHIQFLPKDVHLFSKYSFAEMELGNNIDFHFDTDVRDIVKKNNQFVLTTEYGEITAKKVLIATGRAGWMWASEIFKKFGIIEEDSICRLGLRVETQANNLKDFNKSHCSIIRDDIELGQFTFNGTVIPEDHFFFSASEARSNEKRWLSKNVSFPIIANIPLKEGVEHCNRLANLTHILSNERISKEKISTFMSGKSKVSIIPEYEFFKSRLIELNELIPGLIDKAHFNVPTIRTLPPKINIGANLETDVSGMFVVGEPAGVIGLMGASIMGAIAGDSLAKG